MLILAVDTAADTGSIALADESRVIEEVSLHAPKGFGQILFGEIDGLLKRHGIELAKIDLYAGAKGPGSFTGIRIGLAAIKGLAEVMSKPAIGISNLEALAEFGTGPLRAPIVDAKRGEVYAAVYDAAGQVIIPPVVAPLAHFIEIAGDRNPEWISADFPNAPEGIPAVTPAPRALARTIARIALRRFLTGGSFDPIALDAEYVRRSDAEIFWKG